MSMMNSLAGGFYDLPAQTETIKNNSTFWEDLGDFIGWGANRRQFERDLYLRNTAYQAAVDDMKDAGLNPYLAYQQGGAAVPSVSASQGHFGSLVKLVGTALSLAGGVSGKAMALANTAMQLGKQKQSGSKNYDYLYDNHNLDNILK